ncbi:recombinase family protein [Curtobacterium sp. TC1]|uniref:recombinase family protein n=1 Tax=Curtobacterium sp. TC1 TaxID=2862880 RepID=UPI001C9A5E62|nr:recombinase family protein [Curtobacterium sp. TC1]QZQ54445.1 recombinase family protein [Curtobacterium sp. TC1]
MKTVRFGYIRLSRDDRPSHSIANQKKALLAYDPSMRLFVDEGVSGESNLTDPKSAWRSELLPALLETPTAEVVLYSFDRLGRKKGKVISAVEDIIDGGGTLYIVRENKTFDDVEEASQSVELIFTAYANENYRVDVEKKTARALGELHKIGVKLGRRPSLSEKDAAKIKELRRRGLGATAIGRVVQTTRVGGRMFDTAPREVRRVLNGTYVTREVWERRNQAARLNLLNSLDK